MKPGHTSSFMTINGGLVKTKKWIKMIPMANGYPLKSGRRERIRYDCSGTAANDGSGSVFGVLI